MKSAGRKFHRSFNRFWLFLYAVDDETYECKLERLNDLGATLLETCLLGFRWEKSA